MANTRNRALAWVLSLALALTFLPVNALAEGITDVTELESVTLKVGETNTPTWALSDDGDDAPKETWTSSNEAVATVEDGEITAVAVGEATISHTYYEWVETEDEELAEDKIPNGEAPVGDTNSNSEGDPDDSSDEATGAYVEKKETILVTVEAAQTSSDSVNTGTAGSGTESSGTEVNSALSDLQERINDLPAVSELEGMDEEKVEEVRAEVSDIWKMIEELGVDNDDLDLTNLSVLNAYFSYTSATSDEPENGEDEPTTAVCTCETQCIEGNAGNINMDCPVCSVDTNWRACKGEAFDPEAWTSEEPATIILETGGYSSYLKWGATSYEKESEGYRYSTWSSLWIITLDTSTGEITPSRTGNGEITGVLYQVIMNDGSTCYQTTYPDSDKTLKDSTGAKLYQTWNEYTYTWNIVVNGTHTWDEGKLIQEPTCLENGITEYHCITCDKKSGTKTEKDIPAVHSTLGAGNECPLCGKVLFTWDEASKTLTFSADIPNYTSTTYTTRPYQDYATQAGRLVFTEDVSQVGDYAFNKFTALKAIGPENSDMTAGTGVLDVAKVGDYVFQNVPNIKNYTFTENVQSLGTCLSYCGVLDTVTFYCTPVKYDYLGFQPYTILGTGGGTVVTTMIIDDPDGIVGKTDVQQQWPDITNLVLNVKEIQGGAPASSLKTLVVTNADSISDGWLTGSSQLTDVTLRNIGIVGERAFINCRSLKNVTIDNVGLIGAYAFDNCNSLNPFTVPDETKLGYSNIFDKSGFEDLRIRMRKILAGQFTLEASPVPQDLTVPNGWESSKIGENNAAKVNEEQVTKAARWTNGEKTEAEVEFQFNYAKDKGMDFLFVVDYSASMARIGNYDDSTMPDDSVDDNSRFFDMQSKLLDVADELLNTPGYNNRVGFVTFSTNSGNLHFQDFIGTEDDAYKQAEEFILTYEPAGETNYSVALEKAAELINGRTDTTREAAVIFISDGLPNTFLDGTSVNGNRPQLIDEITGYANKIKEIKQFDNQATKIFGVLQSVPADDVERCKTVMQSICTEGMFYLSSDTKEFSKAVNNAIGAAYNTYTLVDIIAPDFTLDESSIEVSAGTFEVSADGTTITWTITGVPYVTYTMNYDLALNQVAGEYPTGTFDTNEGNATITLDGELVNQVATPQLDRNFSYTVTIHYMDQNGNHIIDPVTLGNEYSENETVELRQQLTRSFNGYTWERVGTNSNLDGYTLTMPAGNVDLYVYYTKDTYTVRVNYLDVDTGREITDPYLSDISYGYEDEYDVTDALRESIGRYDLVAGSYALTGTVYGDVVINLYYERSYTPRPDPTPDPDPGTDPDPDRPGDGDDTTDIADEDVPLAELPGLNKEDHFAYIIGYEDGTVRPEGYITRAEVATIFFRLMTDEYRETYWATSNHFTDVAQTNWYNNGVSTTANVGWIAGYPDGTYRPNNNITRAEFATIAARFLSGDYTGENMFTDIEGHWAADYINRAAAIGWITGYAGQFRPDDYITRAEAVTLINRMLDRAPDADHMLENMIRWPDNPETAWYYEAIQEATNSHDYDRETIIDFETWTVLLENRDWAALEELWAQAADATGGEVADNLTPNVPGDDN